MFDMTGIEDSFRRNPTAEVIEFVNYNDGGLLVYLQTGGNSRFLMKSPVSLRNYRTQKPRGGM